MSTSDAELARQQVASSEREISSIKAQLRALGPPSTEQEGSEANSLTVAWIKTQGLPETAQPRLKLQLSSPIEDAELTSLFDPLASETVAVFKGVEKDQATLTVTAVDATMELGSSIAYEVATLAASDKSPTTSLGEPVVTELPVAILPPGMADSAETKQDEEKETPAVKSSTVCTVTLSLTYQPSVKDQREELYERLNKASQQKAAAVGQLRQVALDAGRQQLTVSSPKSAKPAVQAGFLNKKKATPKQSKMQEWYEKTLGPNSFLRRAIPIAKNYVLFFGVVGFFHFKGQILALPPPV